MSERHNHNSIKCKICGTELSNQRAKISKTCVPCKETSEGDFRIYINEPLGTREEFRMMSSKQSMTNKQVKF